MLKSSDRSNSVSLSLRNECRVRVQNLSFLIVMTLSSLESGGRSRSSLCFAILVHAFTAVVSSVLDLLSRFYTTHIVFYLYFQAVNWRLLLAWPGLTDLDQVRIKMGCFVNSISAKITGLGFNACPYRRRWGISYQPLDCGFDERTVKYIYFG